MAKVSKTGRNDLCACGSGKKFKKCCALKSGGGNSLATILIVLVATAVLGAVVFGLSSMGQEGTMTPGSGTHVVARARTLALGLSAGKSSLTRFRVRATCGNRWSDLRH